MSRFDYIAACSACHHTPCSEWSSLKAAALLCEGVQGNIIHIVHIVHIIHIVHIMYILHMLQFGIIYWFLLLACIEDGYEEENWHVKDHTTKTDVPHANTQMCLCFCAGGVQGHRRSGHILHILYICYICYKLGIRVLILFQCCTAWLNACQSAIVYERSESAQVLYVILVSSVLGRLPLVQVGNTGTIPYEMRRESAYFPGAYCNKTKDGKNVCRWWYITAGLWVGVQLGETSSDGKIN